MYVVDIRISYRRVFLKENFQYFIKKRSLESSVMNIYNRDNTSYRFVECDTASSTNNDSLLSHNSVINDAFLIDDDDSLSTKALQSIFHNSKGYYSFKRKNSIDSVETSPETNISNCMNITHNIIDQTYEILDNKRYFKDTNILSDRKISQTEAKSCLRNNYQPQKQPEFICRKKPYFTHLDTLKRENNSLIEESEKILRRKEEYESFCDLYKIDINTNEQNNFYDKQDLYLLYNNGKFEPTCSCDYSENVPNYFDGHSEISDSFDCSLTSITFPQNREFHARTFSENESLNGNCCENDTNTSLTNKNINNVRYEFPRDMQSRLETIVECSCNSYTTSFSNINNNSCLRETDNQLNTSNTRISKTHFNNSAYSPAHKIYRSTLTVNLKKWDSTLHEIENTEDSEVADCFPNCRTFPSANDSSDNFKETCSTYDSKDMAFKYNCQQALATVVNNSAISGVTPVIGNSMMLKSSSKTNKSKIRQITTTESGKLSAWNKNQWTSRSGTKIKTDSFHAVTNNAKSNQNKQKVLLPSSHTSKTSPKAREKNGNVKTVRTKNVSPRSSPVISTTPIKPVSHLKAFFSRKPVKKTSKPGNKPSRLHIPRIYEKPINIPVIIVTKPSPKAEKLI